MGKGDRDRTKDREKYEKNYARVFEPSERSSQYDDCRSSKEPLKADAEKHEEAFRRNECKNKDIG